MSEKRRQQCLSNIESKMSEMRSLVSSVELEVESLKGIEGESKPLNSRVRLNPALDPDPYGKHGLSLAHRLEAMGFRHAAVMLR